MTPDTAASGPAQLHTNGTVRLINRNTESEKTFIECACGEVFGPDADAGNVIRMWTGHARGQVSVNNAVAAGDIDLTPHENGLPGGKYPRTWCDCGSELIYTPEGWQHDSAPYLWGDDHDSSVDADDDAIAARWQAAFDAQNEV